MEQMGWMKFGAKKIKSYVYTNEKIKATDLTSCAKEHQYTKDNPFSDLRTPHSETL